MWCPTCRSEVAAATDPQQTAATCVACGTTFPIAAAAGPPAMPEDPDTPAARRARELLDRWTHLFEEGGEAGLAAGLRDGGEAPTPAPEPQPQPVPEPAAPAVTTQVAEKTPVGVPGSRYERRPQPVRTQAPEWRIHEGHGTPVEAARARAAVAAPPPHAVPGDAPRIHAGHAPGPAAPHFDPVAAGTFGGGPARAAGPLGQLLAYGGVLGLTVGGAFVVWSYFGGPPGYAPTGWLLTTAGQMLLFLGIVTLIAGDMERTTHEVRTRIETLSGSLGRIEQAQKQAMKAPHIPAAAFADPDAAAAHASTRRQQTAGV